MPEDPPFVAPPAPSDGMRGMTELREGQVIFRSSRHVTVLVGGEEWRCEPRGLMKHGGRTSVVVGDQVEVEPDGERTGRVMRVLPRRNQLSRRREVGGGRELVIAANLDRVLAVFAARQPRLKFGALDRLLVAAEYNELPATIVINKVDLGLDPELEERLQIYPEIGYPVLKVSAKAGEGLDPFQEILGSGANLVSGPSGVGKSSLLSHVLGIELRVGEVSHANEKGKHTTTAVTWYPLPDSVGERGAGRGAVIDTPGFREYGLWGLEPSAVAHCMPDLFPFVSKCRFGDCLHRDEPHCGVRSALELGEISAQRYRSYLGILESVE